MLNILLQFFEEMLDRLGNQLNIEFLKVSQTILVPICFP